ncbi:MAG: hypothetical protein ACHREM_21445 [Polyangiales bacterium]
MDLRDRRKALLGLALAIPFVGVGVYLLRPTDDEAAIRKALDRLCAAVRVDPAESNPLARLARVRSELSEIVSENVTVDIPDFPQVTSGRRPLADLATQAGLAYSEAEVALSSVTMRMAPSKKSCAIDATATLTGKGGAGPQREVRRVSLRVDVIDGNWRVASIAVNARSNAP